jgi:hypothetical protein
MQLAALGKTCVGRLRLMVEGTGTCLDEKKKGRPLPGSGGHHLYVEICKY